MCDHFKKIGGVVLDKETGKLYKEISEHNLKLSSRERFKNYLFSNWISIAALVVAIIALLK